ncbi:hypothetical protein CEXT_281611 [Caerostris extrusa]|uniref:Ycf15 n=1 Tax=Caerostris extrusa TaxID=172846 RepID=A0AAV4WMV4_CAEEX|nr:hypothetical protein CEXT_281611 [Caerostris extrusa]
MTTLQWSNAKKSGHCNSQNEQTCIFWAIHFLPIFSNPGRAMFYRFNRLINSVDLEDSTDLCVKWFPKPTFRSTGSSEGVDKLYKF